MAKVIHGPDGLVKVCPKCWKVAIGKWVDILRDFGRNRSRSDGLTTYCRTCRERPKNRAPKGGEGA